MTPAIALLLGFAIGALAGVVGHVGWSWRASALVRRQEAEDRELRNRVLRRLLDDREGEDYRVN